MEVKGLLVDGFQASWSSATVTKVYDDGPIVERCIVSFDDVSCRQFPLFEGAFQV